LKLLKAESEGFIEIFFPSLRNPVFMDDIKPLYLERGDDDITFLWNMEREEILNMAFEKYLDPLVQAHVRSKLTSEAVEWVATKAALVLEEKLLAGPLPSLHGDADDEDDRNVLVLNWVWPHPCPHTFLLL